MEASISLAELEVVVRRTGLPLDATQLAALHAIYGYFEAMQARIRAPRDRFAEPSNIFVPGDAQ